MAKLSYQNPQDRKYERQGFLRQLFGPSQAEIWNLLAQSLNAQFKPGSAFKGSKVIAEVGEWSVTIDTYTESSGESSTTYTRIRAPYVNRDGMRFTLYHASVFSSLGKMLGMQDIEVGYSRFDEEMVVRGENEAKIRHLLADRELCDLILAQKHLRIDVKDDEGWFGTKFPEHVDELQFLVYGTIKDLDRLHALFDLFSRMLHRLCAIGSAYENDPGIELN